MAPDTLSSDLLLALAQDHHHPDACAHLADQISTLLLTRGEDQNGHAGAILTSLLPRLEERARANLAKRFASSAAIPPALVRRLAGDVIRVAYPILLDSPVLTQEDLASIVATQGRDHRLAIAQRAHLTEMVTAALVMHGPEDVVVKTLRNPTARFSEETFQTTVALARRFEALQVPLGHREDLPAPLVQEILSFVSDKVKAEILHRLQPQALSWGALDPYLQAQITAVIERRRPVDGLLLLETLRSGSSPFFEPLLAQAVGASVTQVRDLLARVPHRLLLCAAALLDLSARQLSHLWLHFCQARPAIGENGVTVASVLSAYSTITRDAAERELRALLLAFVQHRRA